MKHKFNYKIGLIVGFCLIIIAIIIGLIIPHDIAFVFAGLGTISIGFSILTYINKDNNKQ